MDWGELVGLLEPFREIGRAEAERRLRQIVEKHQAERRTEQTSLRSYKQLREHLEDVGAQARALRAALQRDPEVGRLLELESDWLGRLDSLRQRAGSAAQELPADKGGNRTPYRDRWGHPDRNLVNDLLVLFAACRHEPDVVSTDHGNFHRFCIQVWGHACTTQTEPPSLHVHVKDCVKRFKLLQKRDRLFDRDLELQQQLHCTADPDARSALERELEEVRVERARIGKRSTGLSADLRLPAFRPSTIRD
jgi:hypothetical protein